VAKKSLPPADPSYTKWLGELKAKVRQVQLKAALAVNEQLLRFYWDLGADIVHKQAETAWGEGLINSLSRDLSQAFPDMKGFSASNLRYARQWFLFYSEAAAIHQQPVGESGGPIMGQITKIPWGHNLAILAKCKNPQEALYYVGQTLAHNWSRSVLVHQIEGGLYQREGNAITNFSTTLPTPQSDLARQTLKDPYIFDFLSLSQEHNERDLEKGLLAHITQFLLELGSGFAYVGKQLPLQVGAREFFLDLLFYHTRLHCYVVIELKTVDFEPEHAGKMNFYIKAVDEQYRQEKDEPTIGLLLCKGKDKLVAEYALSDIHKPIGVSAYQLTQSLPDNLKPSLPSIEEIENEFAGELKSHEE